MTKLSTSTDGPGSRNAQRNAQRNTLRNAQRNILRRPMIEISSRRIDLPL